MSTAEGPSDAARTKFIDKLNQFRGSLDQEEQRMLDALVAGARQGHAKGDVEVYWFTSGLSAGGTQPYGETTNIWSGYAGNQGGFGNTPFSS
jgi:hypothetical protein